MHSYSGLAGGAVSRAQHQVVVAQCADVVWQLRGQAGAGAWQVDGVKLALQHNIGLRGAAVVTLYEAAVVTLYEKVS
jgi:hypothetical protein